jgi:hypothetical protein
VNASAVSIAAIAANPMNLSVFLMLKTPFLVLVYEKALLKGVFPVFLAKFAVFEAVFEAVFGLFGFFVTCSLLFV